MNDIPFPPLSGPFGVFSNSPAPFPRTYGRVETMGDKRALYDLFCMRLRGYCIKCIQIVCFLFASFAIVRSFFRLFVQYDYHINQCNTSLLNKHRIIYKIVRASILLHEGQDAAAQHHSHRQHRPQSRATW